MRTRAALVAVGTLLIGYAVVGALADPDLRPTGVLLFLAGVLAGHDLVWMAVLLAVGALLARWVPERHRPVVRAGVISAATVTVVAVPLVLGFGRPPDDPSVLPLPYGRHLAIVLLLIAGATLLTCWAADRRRSRRPAPAAPGGRPARSALHRAGGEPLGQEALPEGVHDHHGDADEQ